MGLDLKSHRGAKFSWASTGSTIIIKFVYVVITPMFNRFYFIF